MSAFRFINKCVMFIMLGLMSANAILMASSEEISSTGEKERLLISSLLEKADKKNREVADLTSGKILDIKSNLSLVIANLGARNGVNIGMPFQVWRNNHFVGSVQVVDVRDNISGAIVQNINTAQDILRVGDQLHVDVIR